MSKFIKTSMSLLISLTILFPLPSILQSDFSFILPETSNTTYQSNELLLYFSSEHTKTIENDIENLLQLNGYTTTAKVSFSLDKGTIVLSELQINIHKNGIDQNKQNINIIEDIKNIVKTKYDFKTILVNEIK